MFPSKRMRRLRKNKKIRQLVSETALTKNDLILPLFIKEGVGDAEEIPSMPGQYRLPLRELRDEALELVSLGIPGVILFGIPSVKDDMASEAYNPEGIIQRAVGEIKDEVGEDLIVITDVCLCEYMEHGHCGMVKDGRILNDDTLELLAKTALSHAEAGADIVAPSDMMDGRVTAIRGALNGDGFEDAVIMSYAAKFASSFYGPFREAVDSTPAFGDRKTYQMNPANVNEAFQEVYLDVQEGADILMVKPALSYLDVIQMVKAEFALPTAAYNVSGEYSMVKAAAKKGYIDERSVVLELLTSIKRAGADMVLTYHAKDVAKWLDGK
ncbi:MAG: porphobilinogen synthase [Candidatus Hydrothermarchaeota archaeon]|nr:porphobilinogen synthase [Candidatus Hydrothermarchaeota archaeon]